MSKRENSRYYADRALAEQRLMEAAADHRAAAAHAELAARYEALASDPSLELPVPEAATLHAAAGYQTHRLIGRASGAQRKGREA